MAGRTVKRHTAAAEVQVLMVRVKRNRPVAREIDALPDSDQMRHTIDQTDLGPLKQQVRMSIELRVLLSNGRDGENHQPQ